MRDATLILLLYRHGLRVVEMIVLRWDVVDLHAGLLHVCRVKRGRPSVHPLRAPELRALRQWCCAYPGTVYLFVEVRLVEFGGGKRLMGFAGLTNVQANDETKAVALQRARAQGFLDTGTSEGERASGQQRPDASG